MIEVSHRFQADMADLFTAVLSNPVLASAEDYQVLASQYRHHMTRAIKESRSVYCSFLRQDVESIAPLVLDTTANTMPKALYVDWLNTRELTRGMYLTQIPFKFRENSRHPLASLAIVDPLPFDYEPILRRVLEFIETPGLQQITIVTGVLKSEWVKQLRLEIEDVVPVATIAMAIVDDSHDLTPFIRRLGDELRLAGSVEVTIPDIVRARMNLDA